MLAISKDNREEIEREFLSLILHKQEIIEIIHIFPKYLVDEDNRKMLQYFIESYKEFKMINIPAIKSKHSDFNTLYFYELIDEVLYYENNWKQQLEFSEESIIRFYKEDIINSLNKKLENKEINYNEFVKNIKSLDEIKTKSSCNNTMLTIDDIDMSKEENGIYVKSNTYKLDEAIKGFCLGQLSVWSGGNASAKSTYLNQIALESIEQGYNVAIYSGELVAKRLLKWIITQAAGPSNMSYNSQEEYWFINSWAKENILKWLNNKLFIYDNDNGNKAREVLLSIQDCIEKNNVKILIIDNLMSMDLNSYGDNKYDVQSQFIKDLSAMAKKHGVHIHFVCHPRKSTTFLRKVDISGSADLTNFADNVFIMHRVNHDFVIKTKELYKWEDSHSLYQYSNVIEVCKNRDFGIEDYFVGMHFQKESKRLMNTKDERKKYKWEK